MRWQQQLINQPLEGIDGPVDAVEGPDRARPLPLAGAVTRTFDTPEFQGVTFYEVRAKSVLNQVPPTSQMPFRWTVNPYRGCTHACRYCFARGSHRYLDLDTGQGFDTQVVVKVNAGKVLRHELAAPRWSRQHVAMGTNTDPYQRAEGRYRLMPPIVAALRDFGAPFSILTKGTLILRDEKVLAGAAAEVGVGVNLSIGFLDPELWRSVEPGTPSPRARLRACARLTELGLGCGVLMAPILPYLTDSEEAIDDAMTQIAAAGARHVSAIPLHLRPGAREWFLAWLDREHPDLRERYQRLYRGGAYADADYRRLLSDRVAAAALRHGLDRRQSAPTRLLSDTAEPTEAPQIPASRRAVQLSLL